MKVFQSDISLSSIRKKAERDPIGALVKFHHSRIKRLTTKLKKLEQAKTIEVYVTEISKNVESEDIL